MSAAVPHLIIGNPDNRRVAQFVAALAEQDQPEPIVLAHEQLIDDTGPLQEVADEPYVVRIDSVGEHDLVARKLYRLGLADALAHEVSTVSGAVLDQPLEHGIIMAPRQHHFGFVRYLDCLQAVFDERSAWRILSPIAEIKQLFDKRICSARYRALGVPVAEAIVATTPKELRAEMGERGWERVFVKLSCASSASCLAIFSMRDGRASIMTTIEHAGDKMYNSLRVRRLSAPRLIDQTLWFLLREGAQIERAIPKARLDGAFMDCRMLAIAGEPMFTVVRQNTLPITNLHLGGHRGDLAAFERAVPADVLEAAHQSCRTIAATHGCLQLGIDVLFTPGFGEHRVIEANAFGDLLPRLERDGLSVYAQQIHAVVAGRSPRSPKP